jgi:hypothetical protein
VRYEHFIPVRIQRNDDECVTMTVAELVDMLSLVPQDSLVLLKTEDGMGHSAEMVVVDYSDGSVHIASHRVKEQA